MYSPILAPSEFIPFTMGLPGGFVMSLCILGCVYLTGILHVSDRRYLPSSFILIRLLRPFFQLHYSVPICILPSDCSVTFVMGVFHPAIAGLIPFYTLLLTVPLLYLPCLLALQHPFQILALDIRKEGGKLIRLISNR